MKTGGSIFAQTSADEIEIRALVRTKSDRHVKQVSFTLDGKEVLDSTLTANASAESFIAFSIASARKGAKLVMKWVDSDGDSGSATTLIS